MQISTKPDCVMEPGPITSRPADPAQSRLRSLGAGVYGAAHEMGRAARGILSRAAGDAFGQLRSRLVAARGAARRGRRMRVVESLALGGRCQLLLVRCDEQEYLVGTGPESVETIVLRQPTAVEQQVEQQGGAVASAAGPATSAKTLLPKAQINRAGLMRSSLASREPSAPGPWLVTTVVDAPAIANNRIRETDSGQGWESW